MGSNPEHCRFGFSTGISLNTVANAIIPSDCTDNWEADVCEDNRARGRCGVAKVKRNCPFTCRICGEHLFTG